MSEFFSPEETWIGMIFGFIVGGVYTILNLRSKIYLSPGVGSLSPMIFTKTVLLDMGICITIGAILGWGIYKLRN